MRRSSVVPFVLVLLTLSARATSAQTGAISGTVTASSDSSPIQSALVQAFDVNHAGVRSALTDASGLYSITGLTAGTYYVLFTKSGFVQQAFSGIPCVSAPCYNPRFRSARLGITPTAVTVSAGVTTAVNAAMDVGGTISGTVTRVSDGTLIPSETIVLYDSATGLVDTAIATNGVYSFTGLAPGTYYARTMRAYAGPFFAPYIDVLYGGSPCISDNVESTPLCRVDSGTPIVVGAGTPTITANFSLPPAAHIAGHVTDASTGAGIPSITVAVYAGSTQLTTATTDASGAFLLNGLNPGTYFVRTLPANSYVEQWYHAVCVACAGAKPLGVSATSGATTSGIDFALASSTAGISGTVTLGVPTPPQFAGRAPDIQIYNADGSLVRTLLGAAAGPWSTTGLPPGTYYVRSSSFSRPQPNSGPTVGDWGLWVDRLYGGKPCVAADCDPRQGTPIVVTANAITSGIDLNLEIGAQIWGYPGSADVTAGAVRVFDARGVLLPQRTGMTGGLLIYQVFGLPAGTYYLVEPVPAWAPAGPGVLYQNLPCDGCAVTSGTPVVLTAGARVEVDFGPVSTHSISGTVRSDPSAVPPGQPLEQITIEAYAPDGHLTASTTTFADGTYTIGSLPPGTYYVRTRNLRSFIDQVYNGQTCGPCDPVAGSAVVVPSDTDVSGIDFSLAPGQTIAGQVLAAGGPPIPNAGVLVYAATPSTPAAHITTDSSGGYLATLPAGAYFVQTDPVGGYTQQIYNGVACPQGTCPTGSATQVAVSLTPVAGVNFNLPVCATSAIAPVSLAEAAVGTAYRQVLLATGASGSVQFTVSSGTLPPGLTLDPNTGVLSGTPTEAGQFTFTVSATDSTACAGSRTYTLDVPPCAFTLTPTSASLRARGEPWLITVSNTCGPFTATSNTSWITVGTVTSTAVLIGAAPNAGGPRQGMVTIGPRVFTVFQSGAVASPPFGFVDAPADGSVVSGSVAISGWALAALGVPTVLIYRDPVTGEPPQLIFVGRATFVPGARPDVEALYHALPFSNLAGWGYLVLTNMLPHGGNGTFRFWVYAQDSDLNQTLLGTKTINVNNASATAPFGAIDTPGQGDTVSGAAFVDFGWALTPQPKTIPFDGSTIHVLLDGVDVGAVTGYNFFRPDVSTLFPGLNNSNGPVGYRILDTTALSEGLHTIAWLATDDGGITTGIGSRFFTVSNSAWQPSLRAASQAAAPPALSAAELAQADATMVVPPRVNGVDLGRDVESLTSLPVDADGARTVQMSNLQVLQLSLTPTASRVASSAAGETCTSMYAGYLVVNGQLRVLPVGSSLDAAGTFYWHPGTAFFGTYHLLFVRTSCDRTQQRIPVDVHIQ